MVILDFKLVNILKSENISNFLKHKISSIRNVSGI